MCSASSPIVVSSPCPVCTTVSAGSVSSRSRIEATIVGKSEYDRPVAPGPPWNRVSPAEHHAEVGRVEADRSRGSGPACAAPAARCRRRDRRRRRARRRRSRVGWVSRHSTSSSGCSRTGASSVAEPARGAALTWSSWAWVQRIASTRRSPTAAAIGVGVVRGVDDDALVVVADQPDVVLDLPGAAVEAEGARRDDLLDRALPRRHELRHSTTTERSTSPRCIFVERRLDVVEADRLGDELVQRQPALQVAGRPASGSPASGRQSPYHDDLSAPPRPKNSISGISSTIVRGGHADQHDRAGQVAGEEGLSPGLRAADRVDHDVGAEAAGERPDRLDRRRLPGVDGVRRAEVAWPTASLRGSTSTRDDRGRARQPGPGDGSIADPAAADHRHRVAAGDAAGVDRRAEPGHHPAAEQPGDGRAAIAGSTLVHWPAATSVFSANAPMPSAGRQRGAVGQASSSGWRCGC